MNTSTLVYSDDLVPGEVVDDKEIEANCSDDEEDDFPDNTPYINTMHNTAPSTTTLQDLFKVAKVLRQAIKESEGVEGWPPDSHDLTFDQAIKSVPTILINFVAWTVGFSEDPLINTRVNLSESEQCKVVSICQDLIYAEGRGRKQTEKSLALGVAVRQLTGSIKVIELLHGLGHSVSPSTVYKHDSALAIAASSGTDSNILIPRNINSNTFTTLVWDNNDFKEETMTGKGTTHVTNGIAIQVGAPTTLREKVLVSKNIRTVKGPETRIDPYFNTRKGVLSLHEHESEFTLEAEEHLSHQNWAKLLDFAYIMIRM